jgi:Transposase domain (DUF772)
MIPSSDHIERWGLAMMGRPKGDQSQLFYEFDLDDAVPADHLVRAIDALLDLSWVHAELAPYYPPIGRPSINPVLMIRMLIVSYVFAIRSERLLCREVQVNLAYRWFCGLSIEDRIPDHSALSRVVVGPAGASNKAQVIDLSLGSLPSPSPERKELLRRTARVPAVTFSPDVVADGPEASQDGLGAHVEWKGLLHSKSEGELEAPTLMAQVLRKVCAIAVQGNGEQWLAPTHERYASVAPSWVVMEVRGIAVFQRRGLQGCEWPT